MILTSNRGFAEWGEVFGDPVVATAIGYFITPSSFRSRVRVIASVSTPILYPSTSIQMPRLNRRPRRSNVAVDRQKPEVLIAQTADRRPR